MVRRTQESGEPSIRVTPGWVQAAAAVVFPLISGLAVGGLFIGRLMFAPAGDYAKQKSVDILMARQDTLQVSLTEFRKDFTEFQKSFRHIDTSGVRLGRRESLRRFNAGN